MLSVWLLATLGTCTTAWLAVLWLERWIDEQLDGDGDV